MAFGFYYSTFGDKKIDGFKIYCYKDSAGEKYAKDNGFNYSLFDNDGVEGELTLVDPLMGIIKVDDKEYEVEDSFDFNSVMESLSTT